MFLISWNVAGWSSTSQAIRESFGSIHDFFACTEADIICLQECKGTLAKLSASPVDMGASDPPVSRRPVVAPLERLAAQEKRRRLAGSVEGDASTVSSGGGCNDGIDGWESFWSLSGKQHRGFNGVVTFARKGLTWRCDSQPFSEDAFNEEGRAVVTYHSAFVLVNVYVPNARGGARHTFKLRFLYALEKKMEQLRKDTGKPVILVGDLNMTYCAHDAAWSLRRIHLGTLLQLQTFAEVKGDTAWTAALPHLSKAAVKRVANMIASHLCAQAQEIAASMDSSAATAGSSSGTGVVSVDTEVNSSDNTIDREALQRLCTLLPPRGSGGTGKGVHDYESPPVSLRALYDVGFRCAYTSDFVKSSPCLHNSELYAVVQFCGLAPHSDASAEFMGRLLQLRLPVSSSAMPQRLPWTSPTDVAARQAGISQVRMWDTFLLTREMIDAYSTAPADSPLIDVMLLREVERPRLRPYCPCPYTCWDQSRNRRLENEGTRLDYILVDSALLPAVVCRAETANNVLVGVPERSSSASTAPEPSVDREDFFSELHGARYRDGVMRAMANGAYPPAPFDGTGMPALSEQARELCFAGLPSTGLFVTPPQFSDHIGVGLLLDLAALGTESELLQRSGKVIEDHKCMYRPPVGLHTFFAAAAAKKAVVSVATPPVQREVAADDKGVREAEGRVAGHKRAADSCAPLSSFSASTSARAGPTVADSRTEDGAAVACGNADPCIIDVDSL
ncbi:endonuclease/exonuclease protein-like protein [Leishmania infantum JPCM5]|uniref:Endonuclease/exonuclease_protein-like_protein n=2 Tax=Leishmania infantum TaxID=5671 RepID=A0A6L0Y2P6_LEIIN|nr:endonuclease/exonuclease protein-like protein [Leishmania infantum JPCM5]CAC9552393.1 endonuclease/exonuclease_protein-like_protein [Leishmania infantum]CAM73033.1 endonuclease/exonuclease protein-like protein [Leishmania infantum JPCM5]SUZ46930.1 endonuclease/exonuclease_protein-like_protein [Leishmania infantum]|eukprot:XP_001469917.1 endonuclease/exonuclease protein-like protein [Leishmania infantum JPCM5]